MSEVQFVVTLNESGEGEPVTAEQLKQALIAATAYPMHLSPTYDHHVRAVKVERVIGTKL